MPASVGCRPERAFQRLAADRSVAGPAGAQPARVVMCLPEAVQLVEDRLRQRHAAFLVALADDADQPVDAVDRRDLECRSLTDAQTARIHEQQSGFGDWTPYAAKDG